MKTVAIAGTFDSKGKEFAFVRDLFRAHGVQTLMIHTGVFAPELEVDVSNDAIFAAAHRSREEIVRRKDRAEATAALAEGLVSVVRDLYAKGAFQGILSLGGSGGTSIVTPAMRALPIGVPKIMVSTVASGNVEKYVGTSDIMMLPSIVDVAGINRISARIFQNAVAAMLGLLQTKFPARDEAKPLIGATMFGNTTPCVNAAKAYMEARGYEVLVFHCTGTGGRTFESLIRSGAFTGVLDLTTTEWCDELVGGELAAGTERCTAAAECGVPQIVSVGALDEANFGPMDSVPAAYRNRHLYPHNPMVTLMRMTAEESRRIALELAKRWNTASPETIRLMLPLKGISMIDTQGGPFYDPEADRALFDTLAEALQAHVPIERRDEHINDRVFGEACAQRLIDLIQTGR